MAGRKSRQTVNYFPHMCKHGKSMYIIEQHYGNDGYAFWFKLLECLGATDGHIYDLNDQDNWDFILAYAHLTDERAKEMLDRFSKRGMIDRELWEKRRLVWSDNFVDNLKDVYEKRIVSVPKKPALSTLDGISGPDIDISGGGNQQRNLTELNLTKRNLTPFSVDNSGDNDEETDPAKMTPLQIWKSENLDKYTKAKHLTVPDCPKCKGTGFETFAVDGLGKTITKPCPCWHDEKKY